MIDAKRYVWSKKQDLAKVIIKEKQSFVQFKLFDVHTGKEIEPELQQIDTQIMMERRAILQQEIEGIDMILQDLDDIMHENKDLNLSSQ